MPLQKPPDWVIVIGGSAGSLSPLQQILSGLNGSASIAVFVVIHTMASRPGQLASVLSRTSVLPIRVPSGDNERIRSGLVWIAAPDRHLKITDQGVQLTREVREHHTRPSVDVLFRSAARVFGTRVIAVLLSGYGGDGTSGSSAVHARGGIVVAQDPAEAEIPTMPQRAVSTGHVDHVLRVAEIPRLIRTLTNSSGEIERTAAMKTPDDQTQEVIASDIDEQKTGARTGQTATVVCPDCGGVLWQGEDGRTVHFSCHIGHRWSSDTLLVHKTEALEAALLTALRILKEKAMLLHQTAQRARENNQLRAAERIAEQARLDESYAALIQHQLLEADTSPLTTVIGEEDLAGLGEADAPQK